MTISKFEFDHSLKNIPIPDQNSYLKQLICKTEDFIQRLRLKAIFLLKPDESKHHKNTYGFRTAKNAPQVPELIPFENDLSDLVGNLEFHEKTGQFQNKLKSDVKKINKSKTLFIQADKTHNMYQIDKKSYKKLMHENITSDYKKVPHDNV